MDSETLELAPLKRRNQYRYIGFLFHYKRGGSGKGRLFASICRYLRRRPKTSPQSTPTTPLAMFPFVDQQNIAGPLDKKTLKPCITRLSTSTIIENECMMFFSPRGWVDLTEIVDIDFPDQLPGHFPELWISSSSS